MERTEVPDRFQLWCGIASLLAMLERRVWITQGTFNVYPNFFIILIAASGQKKSTPINVVDKLLRRAEPGPNIVAQKVSPEALISAIKQQEVVDSTKMLKETCGGIVIADELATFLDRGALDRGLGPVLTKLYDCSNFDYQTLKRGTETIRGGYLSILGGTTVELLRNSLPKDAIGGGFTSRTIFVYEDKIPPPVPWVEFDESLMETEKELVDYLSKIFNLHGPIQVTADARALYERDYIQRYERKVNRDNGLGSYEQRRASQLFKVATAVMLAEEDGFDLKLQPDHIAKAIVILEEAEEHMPRVIDLITASDVGAQGNMILAFIKTKKGGVTRSEVVRHFGSKMDAQEITKAVDTLFQGKRINIGTSPTGGLVYTAIDK